VDDEESMLASTRMFLTLHGHDVVATARDGIHALEVAREHQPDVLVLDQQMPNLDGTGAIPGIRSACPQARIIIYSALDDLERFATYADAVLSKQSPPRELSELITRLARA
jgi:DNA-binding NarL/FixJ family response regulator